MHRYLNKIVLSTKEYYYLIRNDDVMYCQGLNAKTIFYLLNGKAIKVPMTFKKVLERLDTNIFLRTHRSFLVNSHYIESYNKLTNKNLQLTNGALVPVSSRKEKEILRFLEKLKRIQIL